MQNEKYDRMYRIFFSYCIEGKMVHFKLRSGYFRNGFIKFVDRDNGIVNIDERMMGNRNIPFEDIVEDSITEYKKEEGI